MSEIACIKYRPDIDGLRAVAVLSVVAYHIGPKYIPGGFVGVDIFFVISGYLISAILFSEIAASRFSVLGFYERRIRRIFPALFGMLILFSAAASFCLLPVEFVEYSKSLLAATTSTSNFYFWRHSGYFDSPDSNPLLHTWSLAVEEQFYILFPIFLVLVRRFFPQKLRISVVLLLIASLAASAVMVYTHPVAAFYMPYTRAWELLLGTIISLGIFPPLYSSLPRNLSTLAGMGLIAYSMFFYTAATPVPGIAALAPCAGTALMIGAGQFGPSLVGRVLCWRPVVFVGMISYSLYLWHWPIIILHALGFSFDPASFLPLRYAALLPAFRFDIWMEIAILFVLAILSWRFVERPFRSRPLRISRRPLFALAAMAMLVVIVFSGAVISSGGMNGRFSPQAVKVASYLAVPDAEQIGRVNDCYIPDSPWSKVVDKDHCLRTVEGKKNYLLIGDSHALTLWTGLSPLLPDENILLVTITNCRPLLHATGTSDCAKTMRYLFQTYLPSHSIQGIFLEARWMPKDMAGLTEIVDWARQNHMPVIVFGPVAEYDAPLPRLLAYSIAWNKSGLASRHQQAYSQSVDAQMQSLAAGQWHIPYISLYKATCREAVCTEYADEAHEVPLMRDGDHFTEQGSALIVGRLIKSGELR